MKRLLLIVLLVALAVPGVVWIQHSNATFTTTAPRNDYTGNGSTATYAYSFRIFAATDLKVSVLDTDGAETTLTYLTDYTVTGVGAFAGGNVVLTSGNLAAGYRLTIRFGGATQQPIDLRNQGGFFPESVEDALDRLGRYIQKNEDVVSRSLHLQETEAGTDAKTTLPSAEDRASQYLAFDASGNPIAASSIGEAPVSEYMQTALDATDGNTVLAHLGTASSDPRLVLNTTALGNRRGSLDFQKNGTSKYRIILDQDLGDAQVLRFSDVDNSRVPLQLNADGSSTLYGALNLSAATSGQIVFPATQNASAGANTLDDYEEGTCTLSLGGTATYTTRTCHYTKIGRQVTMHFNIVVNAIGTGSASTITYSAGPPAVATEGYGLGPCRWSSGAVSPVNLNAYAAPGTSTIVMVGNTAGAANDGSLNLFGNSAQVICSVTYMAAT